MIESKSFYNSLLRESFSSIFPLCFDCAIHIRIFGLIENLKFNFEIAYRGSHFKSKIIICYNITIYYILRVRTLERGGFSQVDI